MKKFFVFLVVSIFIVYLSGCKNLMDEVLNESTTSPFEDNTMKMETTPMSDFEYEINEDGGITIKRYIGQSNIVSIPDTIQNLPVTKIDHNAFGDNIATAISMPNTITDIGGNAFNKCDKLEQVTLSENLINIGSAAFQGCEKLKQITIPSKVKIIGDQAFESAGLETVTFEEGIEVIGGYGSFAKTKIKQIVLPSTVKEIGLSTFANCSQLESVILNEGLITIGHKAFVNNPKLKEIIIPKTVKFVTEMDFNMCSGLEKIMFEGNAPTTFQYSDSVSGVWEPYDVYFTIYYHAGAEGFTSPEWYGYTTMLW